MMIVKADRRNRSDGEYLASIIDSSPVALISLDTSLRIFMFNRAACDLTGFSSDEVMGHRVSRLVGPGRTRDIVRLLRGRGEVSIEGYLTRFRTKDRGDLSVRLKVIPITGSGGRMVGVLLAATDLREIRQLQERILEAERLAAITETAVSFNHEINNPLCSILGYTQLLLMERDRLEPEVIRKLEGIEEQIVRIQEVAGRMSRITRPVVTEYVGGRRMLDVEQSEVGEGEDGGD
ncbi:MAG: PAS domain S-box protein [Candidatus Krumholzibacteria bacterium]|nr:PAS domain S-box protein [Candidatus Krumholzibacteria bacterium]